MSAWLDELGRLLTEAMNQNFLWGQATVECDADKALTAHAKAGEARAALLAHAARRDHIEDVLGMVQSVELPEPDTHCYDTDEERDVWSHSPDQMRTYGDAREAAGYARGRAEAGLVLQTNIGGGSCRHGVRLPHECAACADEASDADVAAWMARTALAGEVKP